MWCILLPLYFSQLYFILSWIDYLYNKKKYIEYPNIINKLENVFNNVAIYLPLTIMIMLILYPVRIIMNSFFLEIVYFSFNIFVYDIWFYICNNIFPFYYFHKKYDNSLGIFALYGNPLDRIISNIGVIYLLHSFLNFSVFQIWLIITSSLINSIIYIRFI